MESKIVRFTIKLIPISQGIISFDNNEGKIVKSLLIILYINKLENGETLEILLSNYFCEYMNYQNISILDKHNISGYLSTEGYFFTI